jgi:hypothetical protein
MGEFEVAAHSDASIDSLSVSAAGAIGGGLAAGISLAGAGAASVNSVANTTKAVVQDSNVGTASLMTVEAINDGDILAKAVGAALTLSIGLGAGSLSFGLSLTENEIANVTLAEVESSSLTSAGAVSVHAASSGKIDALSLGAAISLSGGGLAIAGAIAASIATNAVTNSTQALVLDSAGAGQGLLAGGDITIDASDITNIHATDVAASVAVAAGAIAGAITVAASPATNTIDNLVRANIDDSRVASTGGDVDVTATSNNDIEAQSQAYSLAASLGASGAGAGSSAKNLIGTGGNPVQTTEASITGGSTVSANGTVTVEATDISTINAFVLAVAGAGGAGSAALGISLSDNQIAGTVAAYIADSSASSATGDIDVSASSTQVVDVLSVGVAASNGLSAAGAQASSELTNTVEAYAHSATLGSAFGKVTVDANSSHTGTARTDSVGAGAVDFEIALPSVTIGGSTQAFVDGITSVVAPVGLEITAYSQAVATAPALPLGVGLLHVGTAGATTDVHRLTDAHLGAAFGDATASTITAGDVTVKASSDTSANSSAQGGGGGGISINVYSVTASNTSDVRAYVGANAALTVDSLAIISNANSRSARTDAFIVSISVADVAESNPTATVGGVTPEGVSEGVSEAFIGSNSTIASTGMVSLLGESGNTNATAAATLGQGGILAGIGVIVSQANDMSSTTASVRDGAHINAGSLEIKADSKDLATANGLTAGGGLVEVQVVQAISTVTPTNKAYVGNDVQITTLGDVSIVALAETAEGHAAASSVAGGVGAVGVGSGSVTISPTVLASIGGNTTSINAGGNVTVSANLQQVQNTTPLGDTFSQSQDVNLATDTITFQAHGLQTGDVVSYDTNGNSAIQTPTGPLSTTRNYTVIAVDPNKLQLGDIFSGTAIDASNPFGEPAGASGIDAARDVIVFGTPDNFQTGDAVRYNDGNLVPVGGLNPTPTSTTYA